MSKYTLKSKFDSIVTITQDTTYDPNTRLPVKIRSKTKKETKAAEVDVLSTPGPYGKPVGDKPTLTELSFMIKYMTLQKGYILIDKQEDVKPILIDVEDDLL